jgi:antirestriction protein ArdC
MKADIYRKITDTIVSQLEKGVRPWHKPWNATNTEGRITRPLRSNGLAYNGINVLTLWSDAIDKGFISPYWITYRQAAKMGAQVRKGEHGSQVVYADRVMRTSTDEATGEKMERAFSFLKAYTVGTASALDLLRSRQLLTKNRSNSHYGLHRPAIRRTEVSAV